eukprot:1136389-Pelagomonas_calceolata.AAC.2
MVITIGRAELAAIASALTHKYTHIAINSLSSLHRLRKQILYPEKHRHYIQVDVPRAMSALPAKYYAGKAGNELADKGAKHQTSLKDNYLVDTGIPGAGPGGNPFYNVAWLARKEARPSAPEPSSPIPNLAYFPDLRDALNCHMHA